MVLLWWDSAWAGWCNHPAAATHALNEAPKGAFFYGKRTAAIHQTLSGRQGRTG